MARPRLLYVFAYDIASDRTRAKVAALLEKHMVRVQKSVFEARLTSVQAQRLRLAVAAQLAQGDGLRVYAITQDGLAGSVAHGPIPLTADGHYLLL